MGQRLKESVGINQGLMSLGRVIRALTADQHSAKHVPYRDSKLTRFLQDSIGGNSRTVMVACVSVAEDCLSETLSTLEYASKARLIHNHVVANVVQKNAPQNAGELASLRKQLAWMSTQLQIAKEQMSPRSSDGNAEANNNDETHRLHSDLIRCHSDMVRVEKLCDERNAEIQALMTKNSELEAKIALLTRSDIDEDEVLEKYFALKHQQKECSIQRETLEKEYYSCIETLDELTDAHEATLKDLHAQSIRHRNHNKDVRIFRSSHQNASTDLVPKYLSRIAELEVSHRDVANEIAKTFDKDEIGKLRKVLERIEDEINVLRIRLERQNEYREECKFSEEYKRCEMRETLPLEIGDEDLQLQRLIEEERTRFASCRSRFQKESQELEAKLKTCIRTASDVDIQLSQFNKADLERAQFSSTNTTSFLKRVFAVDISSKNQSQIDVEDLQAKYGTLIAEKIEIQNNITDLQKSTTDEDLVRIIEGYEDRIDAIDAEIGLLKMKIIEASRSPSNQSHIASADEFSKLHEEIDNMSLSHLRKITNAMVGTIAEIKGDLLQRDALIFSQNEEIKHLKEELHSTLTTHDHLLRSIRTGYEAKISYLVQELRTLECSARQISSRSADAAAFVSPSKTSQSSGSSSPLKSSKASASPKKVFGSEIDIAKVINKWKSESSRRLQLEKRNSELLQEIRLLRNVESAGLEEDR